MFTDCSSNSCTRIRSCCFWICIYNTVSQGILFTFEACGQEFLVVHSNICPIQEIHLSGIGISLLHNCNFPGSLAGCIIVSCL